MVLCKHYNSSMSFLGGWGMVNIHCSGFREISAVVNDRNASRYITIL